MRKIIRLTESDIEKIIEKVISEQSDSQSFSRQYNTRTAPSDYLGKGGEFERMNKPLSRVQYLNFECLPKTANILANVVVSQKNELMKKLGVDEKTLLLIAKAAMGILGRETTFGQSNDHIDDAMEFFYGWGMSFVPKTVEDVKNVGNKMQNKPSQQFSLGPAQFTKNTWNQYGLNKKIGNYEDSFNASAQGLGTIFRLNDDYKKALQVGTGTGPSVNPIAVRQGKIKDIKGTGNNALDLAIISHNMSGLIAKWCQTTDPNYAAPCDQKIYQPFPRSKPELKVTVYQGKQILNYFPNKGSGKLTSIGYIEEVATYMNKFTCFSI